MFVLGFLFSYRLFLFLKPYCQDVPQNLAFNQSFDWFKTILRGVSWQDLFKNRDDRSLEKKRRAQTDADVCSSICPDEVFRHPDIGLIMYIYIDIYVAESPKRIRKMNILFIWKSIRRNASIACGISWMRKRDASYKLAIVPSIIFSDVLWYTGIIVGRVPPLSMFTTSMFPD